MIDPKSSNQESGAGEILFFDDFSTGELDRTKWNVVTTGRVYNRELQAYVDSRRTISFATPEEIEGSDTGALVLQVKPG